LGSKPPPWDVDQAPVTVDGDTGTLQPPPIQLPPALGGKTVPSQPIRLKKVDGAWRTYLRSVKRPDKEVQSMKLMAKAYEEVYAGINDGTYATADQAIQAVAQKLAAMAAEVGIPKDK